MYREKSEVKKRVKKRIRKRIKKKLRGTTERPRVFIFKSNRYIYTQAINDDKGEILVSASTQEKEFREKNEEYKNKNASRALGEILARRLTEKKIDKIVFDRGIYPYHGRIKELADTMRKEGIRF